MRLSSVLSGLIISVFYTTGVMGQSLLISPGIGFSSMQMTSEAGDNGNGSAVNGFAVSARYDFPLPGRFAVQAGLGFGTYGVNWLTTDNLTTTDGTEIMIYIRDKYYLRSAMLPIFLRYRVTGSESGIIFSLLGGGAYSYAFTGEYIRRLMATTATFDPFDSPSNFVRSNICALAGISADNGKVGVEVLVSRGLVNIAAEEGRLTKAFTYGLTASLYIRFDTAEKQ